MTKASPANSVVALKHMGAARVANKIKTGQDIGPLEQALMVRDINRTWRRYCSSDELSLLIYVLDRSVGWGKRSFQASVENILTGNETYAPLELSRRTYFRAQNSLIEKQMLIKKRSRDYVVLGLNFDWTEEQLPAPVRVLGKAQKTNSGKKCQIDTSSGVNAALQKCPAGTQNSKSEKRKNIIPSPSAPECLSDDFFPEEDQAQIPAAEKLQPEVCNPLQSVRDHLDGVQAGIEARRKVKTKSIRTKPKSKLNTTDLELVWKQAMCEKFPEQEHMAWSADQKKRIKPFMDRFHASVRGDLLKFARWSVINWQQVLHRNKWMTSAPEFPSVNWWISSKVQDVFSRTRSEIEELKFENWITRTEWDRLKLAGFTDEEARQKIALRAAETRLRSQMRKIKENADRTLEVATARDERSARMDGLAEQLAQSPAADLIRFDAHGKAVLPHPKSPRMQALRDEQRKAEADALLAKTKPSSGPASAVPTETWEQMMERNRLARMGAQNTNDK